MIAHPVYYNDIDPYCCAVLQKNIDLGLLPQGDVDGRDIRDIQASELVGYQHIHLFAGIGGFPLGMQRAGYPTSLRTLTGGFPCQPHSLIGKRQASTDERDLWGEMHRLICETRPDYALAENVYGLLSSESGRFFGRVLRDLASIGYDAEWQVLRASDFDAPHRRERVFIVAYPHSKRPQRIFTQPSILPQKRTIPLSTTSTSPSRRENTIGFVWQSEPDIYRVADGLPDRVDRLKALGNAIVPQCAEYIASCIVAYEQAKEGAA